MSEITNKIYDIKVDKIFIENISFEKVLINYDFLIFAPSRIAYVLIPSSENNTKYETIELEKLYFPILSIPSIFEA